MILWPIDLLAFLMACIAFFFTVRLKSTYFLSSRFFIAVANLCFAIILAQSLVVDIAQVPGSAVLYLSMVALMVASVGPASYLMGENDKLSGFKGFSDFLRRRPQRLLVYLGVVGGWATLVLAFQPYRLASADLGDATLFYIQYDRSFSLANLALLLVFLLMPVMNFYRLSRATGDPKGASSMRVISLAWVSFGIVAFAQSIVPLDIYPSAQNLLQLANAANFVMVMFALREPTVLGRMIVGQGRSDQGLYFGSTGHSVVVYNVESDRRRLVEEFLKVGEGSTEESFCYVSRDEVPLYRAMVQEVGSQVPQQRRPRITIRPIESSRLDTTSTSELSHSRSELIDLGTLDSGICKHFIEERRKIDQAGRVPEIRIWALTTDSGKKSIVDELVRLSLGTQIIDLAANQNSFSSRIGMTHQSLLGTRILLEYDPVSDYEDLVGEFADEFVSNVEPVAVFTSVGSPVHKRLQHKPNVRVFIFSSKISTPSRAVEGQVLLPERDTSLLLDAVDKIAQSHKGHHAALVIDSFTDIVLSQGFEKSYGVLSSIMEMAESTSSAALILINNACLDEIVMEGIRGLFRFDYQLDQTGLKSVRASRLAVPGGADISSYSSSAYDPTDSRRSVS